MWIALFVSFIIVTFSRKRKKKKNIRKLLLILLLICSVLVSKAQAKCFDIQGKLYLQKAEGNIYIFITDKTVFQTPYRGIKTLIIPADKLVISYKFKNVKEGEYAIRCFQDLNDNRKLDKDFIFPAEPWAISGEKNKSIPPKFKNCSFTLNTNMTINLKLIK